MSPRRGKKRLRLIRKAVEGAGIAHPERVATGVDVIGDVAVVRLPGVAASERRKLARALMKEVRNVACVFEQVGAVEGEFRVRRLRHLAGERKTLTTHRENGCLFRVDVAKCYFSPRLSTERLRIAKVTRRGERVLNMFAGVGPFSIPIARLAGARVTSCELNEYACDLHEENDRLNRVERLVRVVRGDALDLPAKLKAKFDRVLMPHPSQADRFLPAALELARKGGVIHYYRHVLGRDEEEAAEGLREELSRLLPAKTRYSIRKVREVGPRWLELAADLEV